MKKLLSIIAVTLAVALTLATWTACTGLNASNAKIWLTAATNAFVAGMSLYNPGWSGTAIVTDVNNAIAAWEVGAGWQNNVIVELNQAQKDVLTIQGCNSKCQGLTTIFLGFIETGIQLAQQSSKSPVPASASRVALPAGTHAYASYDDYKREWNAQAPPVARLK